MSPHDQGKLARKHGRSQHYNPYRDNGTSEQYTKWFDGWVSQDLIEKGLSL